MKMVLFQEGSIVTFVPFVSPDGLLKLTRVAKIKSRISAVTRTVCTVASSVVPSLPFRRTHIHTPPVTLGLMSRGVIHNSEPLSFKEQSGF